MIVDNSISGRLGQFLLEVETDLCGRLVVVSFEEPLLVVDPLEFEQSQTQLFDGGEVPDPQEVLLEGADEAFRATVSLRFSYEVGRGFDAEEVDLLLELVGHVRGAVIMAQLQSRCGALLRIPGGFLRMHAGTAEELAYGVDIDGQ